MRWYLSGEILIISAIIYGICSHPTRNETKIINGQPANIVDYPYQILLLIDNEAKCGGSILTEYYIITAAHCVYGLKANQLLIRAGSSDRTSGGQVINVAEITINTDYDTETLDYDIAILKLVMPLTFANGVQKVNLPEADDEIIQGEVAVATGWGQTDPDAVTLPNILQFVELPQITTTTCQNYYGSSITARMFCAGYKEGGKDTCLGDSGGPLVANGILVGITSWGAEVCAEKGQPGVFTKVSSFRKFIDNIINA